MIESPRQILKEQVTRRRLLKLLGCLAPAFVFGVRPGWSFTYDTFFSDPSQSALVPGLVFVRRSAWAKSPPRAELMNRTSCFSRLTIHHAGNAVDTNEEPMSVMVELNGILDAHLQKRYGDIGYHFIIDYAGRVWEGRSLDYEGAHVSGQNEENIGIMLLGNFEYQRPSPAQISSLFILVQALQKRYAIDLMSIFGHCDLAYSYCPGKYLYQPFVSELKYSSGMLHAQTSFKTP